MTSLMKGAALTMSSREIAELTGKQHKHVIRDARAMLEELEKDGPVLGHQEERDARGYTTAFQLNRELTETLITGYSIVVVAQLSPEFTARLVDRWQELEMDVSSFGRIYLEGRNRRQTEYVLDRELTETLVTGYSVALRLKVKQSMSGSLQGRNYPTTTGG